MLQAFSKLEDRKSSLYNNFDPFHNIHSAVDICVWELLKIS